MNPRYTNKKFEILHTKSMAWRIIVRRLIVSDQGKEILATNQNSGGFICL